MRLSIDFETRSAIDIRKTGARRYAIDPSTKILCLALRVDNKEPLLWVPDWVLSALRAAVLSCSAGHIHNFNRMVARVVITAPEVIRLVDDATRITAFNSGFEEAIWENQMELEFGFPPLPEEKISCTAVRSAVCGLPRSLERINAVLGLENKDSKGSQIMLKLAKPRALSTKERAEFRREGHPVDEVNAPVDPVTGERLVFWHEPEDYPEDFIDLFRYCIQDTVAETALDEAVPELTKAEREIWRLDQKINARGVRVDAPFADAALAYIQHATTLFSAKLAKLTGGAVTAVSQTGKLKKWLDDHDARIPNLQKDSVQTALADPETPQCAKDVLQIRADMGKASTAKYKAILVSMCFDGRIRDLFRHHGAGTGRWAGRGIQVHNLPRGSFTNYDTAISAIRDQDYAFVEFIYERSPLDIVSTLLRPTFCAAQGRELICSDYASVEGRVLAWLAGEEQVLDHYRQGRDLYIVAATTIYGRPYNELYEEYKPSDGSAGDKTKRTIGKPTELGLGYGGGIGAFRELAKTYRVDPESLIPVVLPTATQDERERASQTALRYLKKRGGKLRSVYEQNMSKEAAAACDIIKQRWRESRPKTVAFWWGMERAAIRAVRNPCTITGAGRISFVYEGDYLRMELPSGRELYYPFPQVTTKKLDWGREVPSLSYMTVNATKQWARTETYGGKLAENATQAVACDLLRYAMTLLEEAGYPIVLHVHDEICCEVPKGWGSIKEFESIMSTTPSWADGLPIVAAGGWRGNRYRKE